MLELASGPDASKNATRLTSLNGQIRTLEEQYRQVSSRIAAEAPRLQNLVDTKPASLKALQDAMRAERFELVQYLVQETGVIVWHIGPDSITVRNVFLPRPQVMAKVASLQKSLSDQKRDVRRDDCPRAVSLSDSAGARADSQRAPRHRAARGPELRAVPGVPESGGRPVPWRTLSDQLRAERDGPAGIQAFHDAGGRPSVCCRRSVDCRLRSARSRRSGSCFPVAAGWSRTARARKRREGCGS